MSGITPQQRSRDNLTARGYLVGSVERRKRFPDRKKSPCSICKNQPMIEISVDLWNIFDLVAVLPGGDYRNHLPCTVFVQTTSRNNHSTRRNKVLASMEAKLVLLSGARILIQSWKQPEGERSRWVCFDEWLTLADYDQAPHYPNSVAELLEIKRKAKFPDFPPGVTLPLSGDLKDEEMPF